MLTADASAVEAYTRFQSLADLAGGTLPQSASRTVAALPPAAEAALFAPGAFVSALVSAWRVLALHGDASALRSVLREELGSLLARKTGDRIWAAEIAAMCAALAIMSVRADYAAEQDASAARSDLAAYATPSIEAAGMLSPEAHEWLAGLTGAASVELSAIAANRAPLVRVETGVSLNAIRAAYDLYGDANRAGEIVARNRVAEAAFLPTAFEALST